MTQGKAAVYNLQMVQNTERIRYKSLLKFFFNTLYEILTDFSEKIFQYHQILPIIVLIIVTISKITYLTQTPSIYNFDEYIVTEISKLPFNNILTTILSEPHPPFFYIFLKFLPIENIVLSRICLNLISSCLLLVSFIYAYKNKLFKKIYITIPTVFILCSIAYFELSSNLKVPSIAFPILILHMYVIVAKLDKSNNKILKWNPFNKPEVIFCLNITCLTILLNFISYIYFVYSIIIAFLYFLLKPSKGGIYYLIFIGWTFLLYLYSYGFDQYLTNHDRFGWIKYYSSNFFTGFSVAFYNYYGLDWIFEAIFLITLIIFILKIKKSKIFESFKNYTALDIYIILTNLILIIVILTAKFYSNSRYSILSIYFTLICLFLLISKYIHFSNKKLVKLLLLAIITFTFFATFRIFDVMISGNYSGPSDFLKVITKGNEKKIIFGIRGNSTILIYHIANFENIYPISLAQINFWPYFSNQNDKYEMRDLLKFDKDIYLYDIPEVVNEIKKSKIDTFYFYLVTAEFREHGLLYRDYFRKMCKHEQTLYSKGYTKYYKYTGCNQLPPAN